MKKSKRVKEKKQTQPRKFIIESINGIEFAHVAIAPGEVLSDKHEKHVEKLSKIASRQYALEGRGGFLTVSEANPNEAFYLPTPELLECIRQLIPEGLNKVQDIVDQYDPQKQFLVINVFDRKRIAVTSELLRPIA
ncbi:MAG: hypothetical protein WCA08_16955 [Desulfoferrobacter sp.]